MIPDMAPSIEPIAAFADNYIWAIRRGDAVAVVDPGSAEAVEDYLSQAGGQTPIKLVAILVTHHHGDHVGGIAALVARHGCPVYGPAQEVIPACTHKLGEGDRIDLEVLGMDFDIWHIPGHTSGHIAYLHAQALFCGDTLFAAGCGRLFEGTPAQMHASLMRLAALPEATPVYCAHEYTLANLRFALMLEPKHNILLERFEQVSALRLRDRPSLPSTMGLERRTNPFLRCADPDLQDAVLARAGVRARAGAEPAQIFAALRRMKDVFR